MWWTALLMGLAGSLHCAGMCSPLAMAATSKNPFLLNKVLYNSGRVLVYASMGAFAGAVGSFLPIGQQQNLLSIGLGIVLLLIGLGAVKNVRVPFLSRWVGRGISWVKLYFGKLLKGKGRGVVFLLGTLNGLLPCGLTYMALAYCFVLPSALDGFVFMLLFGLGTWPVMIGMSWLMGVTFNKLRFSYQRITAGVCLLSGMLLIARVFMGGHAEPVSLQNPIVPVSAAVCK